MARAAALRNLQSKLAVEIQAMCVEFEVVAHKIKCQVDCS